MFEQAYQFVMEQLGKNDLLAGGAVLGAMAYLLNYLKTLPFYLLRWLRLAFVTSIDIPDRASSFNWVTDWLSGHSYTQKAKRITVEAKGADHEKATVSPAPGRHFVWWGWTPIIINRIRNESTGDNAARAYRESWSITLIGSRKKVQSFIEECRKYSRQDRDDYIRVRGSDRGHWEPATKRRKKTLDSVILPSGVSHKLMGDINEFINSKTWYNNMSIPWRRGYLLSGPPGCGKSSVITAIASEINFEIFVVNLSIIEEDDLAALLGDVRENAILLFEDIDCVFEKREGKEGISMSTILNCLDGLTSTEGRIVFMTTNHPEKLDPALVRPGRIDVHIELQNATEDQIKRLYRRFYPTSKNYSDFASKAVKYNVSMARLQNYFLKYRNSCREARSSIGELADA